MSMRALWFLLFVLAPLATLAGYGSTYGIGSAGGAGGGVTVGQPVSGGTASRLLHTDASGNVATAATALGAGLQLSGNERVDGTSDLRGAISNGGSSTCSGYGAGKLCINDSQGFIVNFASASRTTGPSSIQLMHIAGGFAGIGFAYNDDTNDQAITSDADDLAFWGDSDSDFIFQPGNSTSVTFEDFGEVRLHRNATGGVTGTDCDANDEVGRIRRYSKDANNITLCVCQKVGGAFGWAAAVAGGDCT